MNIQSAAAAYRESAVESAPPIKIVHMMYEGALRLLEHAERLDPQADAQAFSEKLNRADAIVSELRISLEPTHAPELAERLSALYLFVEERIRDALLDRTVEPLTAARDVLTTLLDGWKKLEVGSDGPE